MTHTRQEMTGNGRTDTPSEAPGDLPTEPDQFWSAGLDLDQVAPPPLGQTPPALERLGPLPFGGGGFPLMGFFATVYDHIAGPFRDESSE